MGLVLLNTAAKNALVYLLHGPLISCSLRMRRTCMVPALASCSTPARWWVEDRVIL